jgi:glutaredoxin
MAPALTVYVSRPAAPLCERVVEFLDKQGYDYRTIDVVTEQDREAMAKRTGRASCPLVVADDEVIGNLKETIIADRSGQLTAFLAGARS